MSRLRCEEWASAVWTLRRCLSIGIARRQLFAFVVVVANVFAAFSAQAQDANELYEAMTETIYSERFADGLRYAEQAERLGFGVASADPGLAVRIINSAAVIFMRVGRKQDAVELFERANNVSFESFLRRTPFVDIEPIESWCRISLSWAL
jgi:hypothetical protein